MGTKRIGRVGERDAGFHSNGALPSALSCCHYGSEVFRSCRKQSYGKPACLDSSSAFFFVLFCFSFSIRLSLLDFMCWCNVIWATEAVYCDPAVSVVSVSLSPFPFIVSREIHHILSVHTSICLLFLLLNVSYKTSITIKWMLSVFFFLLSHFYVIFYKRLAFPSLPLLWKGYPIIIS